MATVAQHQQTSFSDPQNGQDLDADIVRGNDNTLRTVYNQHDADATIHLQSSVAGSVPAGGTAGRVWLETDTLIFKYDNGTSFVPLKYVPLAGGTMTGTLTIQKAGNTDLELDADAGSGIKWIIRSGSAAGTLIFLDGDAVATVASLTKTGTFTTTALVANSLTIATAPTFAGITSTGNLAFTGATNPTIKGAGGAASLSLVSSLNASFLSLNESTQVVTVGGGGVQLVLGSVSATTATTGFPQIPLVAGPPTGAAPNGSLVGDSTNSRVYLRIGGAWKYAALS